MQTTDARHESKTRILQAALAVIRTKGYTATRIEDVCEAAGLTKGSFFHHFSTKEDLAIAAADYWSEITSALFATAPYHTPVDPLERVLAYVDFRKALLKGELPDFTCLVGTMTQEVYDTHPAIREACEHSITDWTAESLALFTQATIQGAFILAKAKHTREVAAECIDHLRRYLELLFNQPRSQSCLPQ
jgi:TetR/AcrR family transcriptional repressor of nem operon